MRAKSALCSSIVCILVGLGCEFAGPLLIGEATKSEDPPGAGSAALTVDVESAEGMVAGRAVTPEMFEATGDRFGDQLQIQLRTEGDLEVWVTTQTESSSTNPYTGDDGFGGGDGVRIPDTESGGPDGFSSEPFADVTICQTGVCRSATDFGIEIVQTESGRDAIIDGIWGDDETIHVDLHYTEAR